MARFMRKNLIKLTRLHDMLYRPSEIAEEIGVTTETVYRVYLPEGAPFERDKKDDIWLHGTSFAAWVWKVYGGREKLTVKAGEGWCCKCRTIVEMRSPRKRYTNRYIIVMQGRCPACESKVNRIYGNNPETRAMEGAK